MRKAFSNDTLQAFVKTIASDEGRLKHVFSLSNQPGLSAHVNPHQYIRVPLKVYDRCWDLHELSMRLVEAMERVSKSEEHALLINEGYDLGYRMPSLKLMLDEMRDFKDALVEFHPYDLRYKEKDYVMIPAEQAVHLSGMINYDAFMISRIFDATFNTDYLKPFSNYRAAGYKYQGPSALQETMDLLVGLIKLSREIERHVDTGVQKRDWDKRVAFAPHNGSLQNYNSSNDMA